MKNKPQYHQPNVKDQAPIKKSYRPRTPITKLHKKIMQDPFIFSV